MEMFSWLKSQLSPKDEEFDNYKTNNTITIYESKDKNGNFKVDAELGRKSSKNRDLLSEDEEKPSCSHFILSKDEGDVGDKKKEEKESKLKDSDKENLQLSKETDLADLVLPFRTVSSKCSLTDVNKLMLHSVEPTDKTLGDLRLTQDKAETITRHLSKMRKDVQRLREMADKFKCLERYENDINFLIENVADAIKNGEKQAEININRNKNENNNE